MNKNSARHSALFLLELIAAIFFFCLASAVCIRFFVKSHTLSADAHNLDMAVNHTTTLAELFQSDDDYMALMQAQCPDGVLSSDGTMFTLYYTDGWTPCQKEEGAFRLTVTLETKEAFNTASMAVTETETQKDIYVLHTEKQLSGEVGLS